MTIGDLEEYVTLFQGIAASPITTSGQKEAAMMIIEDFRERITIERVNQKWLD